MTFDAGFCVAPVPWKRPYSDNCSGGSHSVGEDAQLMAIKNKRKVAVSFLKKQRDGLVTDMVEIAF